MSAMGRTERIVDVHIRKRRHLLGKVEIVLLFARMEAGMFEHDHIAGFERSGNRLHVRADAIGRHGHGAINQRG